MKKLLLLATALLGFASVSAQTSEVPVTYKEGNAITSTADLTSGTYFIKAHASASNCDMARGEGYVYNHGHNQRAAAVSTTFRYTGFSTDNVDIIWQLEVKDSDLPAGATEEKVFSIQAMGGNNYYWSITSQGGTAKHNIHKTTEEAKIAYYQLVAMPADYVYAGQHTENTRFFFQLTNATGNYPALGGDLYPYIHSNDERPAPLGYWGGNGINSTPVQFEIVEAVPVTSVDITVNFPALNGIAIPALTLEAPLGDSPREAIKVALNNLNYGDIKITGITSSTGSEIVSQFGQEFTVQGQWDRELVPGQVYRMRIRPDFDVCGTIRYMLSTGEIETRREGVNATLSRLVPERLWYFTVSGEGENKTYTLHTLHDTSKAVKFAKKDNSWSNAKASLEDEGTELDFAALNNGYITFKIHGTTNGWFNDFGGFGYLSVYPHNATTDANFNVNNIDGGSKMLLYPLTDDDFNALAHFGSEEAINAAKANPTVENIKPLVDAYNSHNTEAALKRIEYFAGTNILGINPGEYSDPSGKFLAAVSNLNAVIANPDATEDEKQAAIDAVNSLIDELNPNQLTRNVVEPGVFYRFRNKTSNKYISCLPGGEASLHPVMAMTADGTRSNTVFYTVVNNDATEEADKEYTIVAYEDGRVLPRFYNTQRENWRPVLSDDELATNEARFAYQDNGCYVIHISSQAAAGGHRHLHGAGTTVNVSGNATNADHQWYIERVTELPVTMFNIVTDDNNYTNDGWSSIYSPVALEVPADRLLTAYTGQFDGSDYSESADINHVLATPIAPNAEGKVIIPGGQTALLFFDGENNDFNINEDPNINASLMNDRKYITYVNLPIVYGGETVSEQAGNIAGHILAHAPEAGKEYYTLHATHSNNFREYGEWMDNYTYVPGFKAHIINNPDGVDVYPIYLVNPNTMAPDVDNENLTIVADIVEGQWLVTIVTPGEDFEVYYKHTPTTAGEPSSIIRKAHEAEGYTQANVSGDTHTFAVTPGKVEYHTYHPGTDTQSVERVFTIHSNGSTTGLTDVTVTDNNAAVCFDLMGRRIATPAKGINIINNKKVLVK